MLAVCSGKGGVGKSTLTANLAVALAQAGKQVGVLDADVYGHSIPHVLGIRQKPVLVDKMIVPPVKHDLKLMSIGFFLEDNAPAGVRIELRVLSASPAVMVDPKHPAIQTAARAFSDMLGRPTVFTRSGGSIPVVGDFANHLRIPSILMGFGLPDDGLHSPNEKYRLENYYKGIMTIAHFFEKYGQSA